MDEAMLCERLSLFYLAGKSAVSLEKSDSQYIIHLDAQSCAEFGSSAKIAASSTNNTVRLYSRDTLAYSHVIANHKQLITGIQFSVSDPNMLYSSSVDGTISGWDIRKRASSPTMVYEVSGYSDTIGQISSFDMSCDGRIICAGTEKCKDDVYLVFWDARKSDNFGVYSECHNNDITQVRFHRSLKDHLLTGSDDNLVCLFDISQSCEDDALISTLNCQSCVSQIGWCGSSHNNIYGLTRINTLHIWDAVEFDLVLELTDIIPEDPELDYLVDCFQTTNDGLYLVAGSYSGDMSVIHIEDEAQTPSGMTRHKGHNGVIRCMNWDNETCSLVTGGEDSMLCLWKTDSPEDPQYNKDRWKAKSKLKSKKYGKLVLDDRPVCASEIRDTPTKNRPVRASEIRDTPTKNKHTHSPDHRDKRKKINQLPAQGDIAEYGDQASENSQTVTTNQRLDDVLISNTDSSANIGNNSGHVNESQIPDKEHTAIIETLRNVSDIMNEDKDLECNLSLDNKKSISDNSALVSEPPASSKIDDDLADETDPESPHRDVNWEDRSMMCVGDDDCYISKVRKPWDISMVVLSDDSISGTD